MMNLLKGDLVEFKDKNPGSTGLSHENIYTVEGECEMKDCHLGWVTAVMYSHEGKLYVREKGDFIKKFKKVKEKV